MGAQVEGCEVERAEADTGWYGQDLRQRCEEETPPKDLHGNQHKQRVQDGDFAGGEQQCNH